MIAGRWRSRRWRSWPCRLPAVALGLIVFPIDFVLKMVGARRRGGLVGAYLRFAEAAFAPDGAADVAAAAGAAGARRGGDRACRARCARRRRGRRRARRVLVAALPPPLSSTRSDRRTAGA